MMPYDPSRDPNSRVNLARERAEEKFDDHFNQDVTIHMEALRNALDALLEPSNELPTRYDAAIEIVNLLNPDGEFGGAIAIEKACDEARAAIQELMP